MKTTKQGMREYLMEENGSASVNGRPGSRSLPSSKLFRRRTSSGRDASTAAFSIASRKKKKRLSASSGGATLAGHDVDGNEEVEEEEEDGVDSDGRARGTSYADEYEV